MRCYVSDTTDPYFNLALEEVLLKESREEFLILSINSPAVITGKHQVALREINPWFVFQNSIPVIRRISGGGTVYHDPGNINFAFIRNAESGQQIDFRKYTEPVIQYLRSLGLDAVFGGKNDIRVGDIKISGNAEHVFRNRVLHHGTLLFNASLDGLRNSLRKDFSCYATRAVNSNPAPVMNLSGILDGFRDAPAFIDAMVKYFTVQGLIVPGYNLAAAETGSVEMLAESKYKTWEWNYAYGPDYVLSNKFEVEAAQCSFSVHVKAGIVEECTFGGNIIPAGVARKIKGRRHMPDEFLSVFEEEGVNVSMQEFYNLF